MIQFKIDSRTLRLLSAQANLAGTYTHKLRAAEPRRNLTFHLHVERNKTQTQFTVEVSRERHSLILPNSKNIHLKLADFIEEVANGSHTTDQPECGSHPAGNTGDILSPETRRELYALVRTGGALNVHVGAAEPVVVAIHRDELRFGIIAIVTMSVGRPLTYGFTSSGGNDDLYEKVTASIHRIALAAPEAAHAA